MREKARRCHTSKAIRCVTFTKIRASAGGWPGDRSGGRPTRYSTRLLRFALCKPKPLPDNMGQYSSRATRVSASLHTYNGCYMYLHVGTCSVVGWLSLESNRIVNSEGLAFISSGRERYTHIIDMFPTRVKIGDSTASREWLTRATRLSIVSSPNRRRRAQGCHWDGRIRRFAAGIPKGVRPTRSLFSF